MTYHDIDEVPVNVRLAEVREKTCLGRHERECRLRPAVVFRTTNSTLVRARIREEHVPDQELRIRTRSGAELAQDPITHDK